VLLVHFFLLMNMSSPRSMSAIPRCARVYKTRARVNIERMTESMASYFVRFVLVVVLFGFFGCGDMDLYSVVMGCNPISLG
jgi:hypothetical protein